MMVLPIVFVLYVGWLNWIFLDDYCWKQKFQHRFEKDSCMDKWGNLDGYKEAR